MFRRNFEKTEFENFEIFFFFFLWNIVKDIVRE